MSNPVLVLVRVASACGSVIRDYAIGFSNPESKPLEFYVDALAEPMKVWNLENRRYQMPMTKHDYEFLAKAMKEIMEAQPEDKKEEYRRAYDALATSIGWGEKYKNFNYKKFSKKAGLK